MEGKDPKDLINQAEEQKYSVADDSLEVFSWFSDNSGEMFLASEVVEAITQDFGWDTQRVRRAITGLVDDSLDPVQQVVVNGNTHIGIIEYKEFQDFGGYGFIEYDDTLGQRKNLVCAKCVSEKEYASEPFRAVEGYGRHPEGCSYNHLLEHLEQHYDDSHSEKPSDIEVGASLVSGTTISSNTAIHGGNQSNFSVTDFAVGVLGDGELLSNSGGTLTGSSVSTDIDLLETQSVPDINNISKPTIAYVNSINDYIAAFGNVIPDTVVENFEDADSDPAGVYDSGDDISTFYSNDTGSFARTSSNVVEGSKAIEITSAADDDYIESTPNDGLNRYVSEGETVAGLIRADGGRPHCAFMMDGGGNGYSVGIAVGGPFMTIQKIDTGSLTELDRTDVSLTYGAWYWFEFYLPTTSDGSMEYRLYDVDTTDLTRGSQKETATASDTTHADHEGVGFLTINGGSQGAMADWIRVI
jgi:hypothetical protein